MNLTYTVDLTDDERALFAQFVATEGNPTDTPESYLARASAKLLRSLIHDLKDAREQDNAKVVSEALAEHLADAERRGVLLDVLGLAEQEGKVVSRSDVETAKALAR